MRLATFQAGTKTKAGVMFGSILCSIAELAPEFGDFPDIGDMLEKTDMEVLKHIPKKIPEKIGRPISEVKLLAPVLSPPKIIALGLNYRAHAEEQSKPIPDAPLLFAKARNAITGHDSEIVIPKNITQVDLEVELAIVIGRRIERPITKNDAENYILGYTIMNDVSARDAQFGDKQWYRGKSFRTFAPIGPVIITRDDLDWRNLEIESRIDGKLMQKSNTKDLIFGVDEIVSYISNVHPLEAGDIIATGTPAGVGVFRNPPVFLTEGQRVECRISGIGSLINLVKKEK